MTRRDARPRGVLGVVLAAACLVLASSAGAQDAAIPVHVVRTSRPAAGASWMSVRIADRSGAIVLDGDIGPYGSGPSALDATLPQSGRYRIEVEVGTRDAIGRVHRWEVRIPRDAIAVELRAITANERDAPWLVGVDLTVRRGTPLATAAIELDHGSVAVRNDGRLLLVIPQRASNVHLDAARLDGTWVDLGRVGAGASDSCGNWFRDGPAAIEPGATLLAHAHSHDAPPLDAEIGPFRLRMLVSVMRSPGADVDAEHAGTRPTLRRLDVHEVTRVLDDAALAAWLDPPPRVRPARAEHVLLALGRGDLEGAIATLDRVPPDDVTPALGAAIAAAGRHRLEVLLDVGACDEARELFATLDRAGLARRAERLFGRACPLRE